MIRQYTKQKVFYPDIWGNLDLPESERIEVSYTNPSMEMQNRINPKAKYSVRTDTFGNPIGGEAEIIIDDRALIVGFNIRIKNYVLQDEKGTLTTIRSAKDLFEQDSAEVGPLIKIIAKRFREELAEDENEKNSESPSD